MFAVRCGVGAAVGGGDDDDAATPVVVAFVLLLSGAMNHRRHCCCYISVAFYDFFSRLSQIHRRNQQVPQHRHWTKREQTNLGPRIAHNHSDGDRLQ
jgi:hypothetical protein